MLYGGEILFIIFSPTCKSYSFGHPSVESSLNSFQTQANLLRKPLMLLLRLTLRELYEQDERFTEFINLISLMKNKKIATISSTHVSMDEDIPSTFPPKHGPPLQ
ncbi:hypothetical protein Goshw_026441 [Gossypium schwendimanii]|uniref:MADS-box domain-containing protein n=1 Tax=Gossypium schwendimanii TaxID=34291 RepID=A0A7J9MDY9_GOSSC|nr:hypothetical protein [Gossypium schwendimanii]